MQGTESTSTPAAARVCTGNCPECPCLRMLAETAPEPRRETAARPRVRAAAQTHLA